ncbi:hypothetical protein BDK51DRAFT_52616 [Blyttiomyces helicus]|uniref:Uncharacterized protein n=1 Tax=Blyttiomyces helicus TaxID=388810 RepID=A0A4P9WQR3_9FUNG|nr:hypothetical protein BDK51DRAFT_52616 [Blyttiomyces helicus]|eukprot:RKO94745.1 hypothetical protein BDK51DRAFT_52616 [Blyttiomyces helicus]
MSVPPAALHLPLGAEFSLHSPSLAAYPTTLRHWHQVHGRPQTVNAPNGDDDDYGEQEGKEAFKNGEGSEGNNKAVATSKASDAVHELVDSSHIFDATPDCDKYEASLDLLAANPLPPPNVLWAINNEGLWEPIQPKSLSPPILQSPPYRRKLSSKSCLLTSMVYPSAFRSQPTSKICSPPSSLSIVSQQALTAFSNKAIMAAQQLLLKKFQDLHLVFKVLIDDLNRPHIPDRGRLWCCVLPRLPAAPHTPPSFSPLDTCGLAAMPPNFDRRKLVLLADFLKLLLDQLEVIWLAALVAAGSAGDDDDDGEDTG